MSALEANTSVHAGAWAIIARATFNVPVRLTFQARPGSSRACEIAATAAR